jgi:hypothetical protein
LASAFQLYAAQDEQVLFSSLRALSQCLADSKPLRDGGGIDPDDLDFLTDHLFIVRPHEMFGRFRFEFCGPAWSRMSRSGDISQIPFVDLFGDFRAHDDLAGYAHVVRMKMAHLSRNRRFVGGRSAYYTRLLIPQIRRDRVVSIIGTTVFHDVPLDAGLSPVMPALRGAAPERAIASCQPA